MQLIGAVSSGSMGLGEVYLALEDIADERNNLIGRLRQLYLSHKVCSNCRYTFGRVC